MSRIATFQTAAHTEGRVERYTSAITISFLDEITQEWCVLELNLTTARKLAKWIIANTPKPQEK